MFTVFLAKQL
uniref:Uncharacterized protein n=1 Tax=Anguilla anguilla TaxID=7936 RepID=A0A0E9T4C1_ANGAN